MIYQWFYQENDAPIYHIQPGHQDRKPLRRFEYQKYWQAPCLLNERIFQYLVGQHERLW